MIPIRARWSDDGHHVQCVVFMGRIGAAAKVGKLVFSLEEFEAFREACPGVEFIRHPDPDRAERTSPAGE